MKTLISITIAISVILLAMILSKSPYYDSEGPRFGSVSLVGIFLLASVATAGLLSLWLLRSRKGLIQGIWMSLWSLGIAYVALDFLAGFIFLERLSPPIEMDKLVHHKLIPSTQTELRSREFSYTLRTNSAGIRGNEIEIDLDKGTYRILMLGDSFTLGKGVGNEETFSALLEESLNATGARVEVLNAGVDSYAPVLSYRQLVTQLGPLNRPGFAGGSNS